MAAGPGMGSGCPRVGNDVRRVYLLCMNLVAEPIEMPRVCVRRFRACKRKRALWKKSRVDRIVGGDPVNYIDKDGRFIFLVVIGIAAVVGAYSGGAIANNGKWNPGGWKWDKQTFAYMGVGAVIGAASAATGGAVSSAVTPGLSTALGTGFGAGLGNIAGGAVGGAIAGSANGFAFGGVTRGNGLFSGSRADILRGTRDGAIWGAIGGATMTVTSGLSNMVEPLNSQYGVLASGVANLLRYGGLVLSQTEMQMPNLLRTDFKLPFNIPGRTVKDHYPDNPSTPVPTQEESPTDDNNGSDGQVCSPSSDQNTAITSCNNDGVMQTTGTPSAMTNLGYLRLAY